MMILILIVWSNDDFTDLNQSWLHFFVSMMVTLCFWCSDNYTSICINVYFLLGVMSSRSISSKMINWNWFHPLTNILFQRYIKTNRLHSEEFFKSVINSNVPDEMAAGLFRHLSAEFQSLFDPTRRFFSQNCPDKSKNRGWFWIFIQQCSSLISWSDWSTSACDW